MEEEDTKKVRIFVGGLGEGVSTEDLQRLFGSLGSVEGVDTIRTKGRSFAYVDFVPCPTDPKSLTKLFSKYNGCLWKGGKLKLEKAKENYLVRLKREWEEDAAAAAAAAEVVSDQPITTNHGPNELERMAITKESLKTKQMHIFFPRLRKVKSIPLSGTGKHKYSFQNIEVPPLPVHFCDCEEHCSPTGTERGKLSFDRPTEIGGMNDEEINIMKAVMNKLLEKEKVSNPKHLEKEKDSVESPDALHADECEVDSATDDDDDDLIINMETEKNKAALIGSEELERLLESQEPLLNKTKIAKEKPKTVLELQKNHTTNPNKKRKSLPKLERESNECVTAAPEGKSNLQALPNELGSRSQPTKLEYGFGESTKVSWSQKSSWKKLVGDGGNTAFNASLILPEFDSGQDQQRSDSTNTPLSPNDKTENKEKDKAAVKELAEAHPTNKEAVEEHAGAKDTDKNVAPIKTGRGSAWLHKKTWQQMVSENNNSFSISQILPGITFPEPKTKVPVVYPANSIDFKQKDVAKDTINEVVGDGSNFGANGIASAPIVEKKMESRAREISCAETVPKERSTGEVEIGETCSFMRNAASLKEWAKAKAAVSGSLKRKRGEK